MKENERGKKGGGESWRMKHNFFSWLCSLKGRACLLACLSLFVRSLSLSFSLLFARARGKQLTMMMGTRAVVSSRCVK